MSSRCHCLPPTDWVAMMMMMLVVRCTLRNSMKCKCSMLRYSLSLSLQPQHTQSSQHTHTQFNQRHHFPPPFWSRHVFEDVCQTAMVFCLLSVLPAIPLLLAHSGTTFLGQAFPDGLCTVAAESCRIIFLICTPTERGQMVEIFVPPDRTPHGLPRG